MVILKHPIMDMVMEKDACFATINAAIKDGQSEVAKSYNDAVVFITGGSGFIGKPLLEKLLRSCKVKKIYILLRLGNNRTFQSRMAYIFKDKLYDWLRENQPDFMGKIIPVAGDVTNIGMGIDEKTMTTLVNEVNIIIHGAATINFTEPLKIATLTNLRGTREMICFGKACKHLKSFIQISTAYVNATKKTSKQSLSDQFVAAPMDPNLLIEIAEQFDEDTLETINAKLLQHWPNTYSFTKVLAEEFVRKNADLPVCVVRPVIVGGSFDEHCGWVDKSIVNGPIGFVMGSALGALHVVYGDLETKLDLVPVDYVVNAILMAGHETIQRRIRGEMDVKIYAVTSSRNPLTIDLIQSCVDREIPRSFVTPKLVWYCYVIVTKNKLLFTLLSWLLHLIPAYLADICLKISGQKPKAVRLLSKAFKQNKIFEIYMKNDWIFEDSSLLEMYDKQSPVDQLMYNCQVKHIEPIHQIYLTMYGVRKYILKDTFTEEENKVGLRKEFWLRIINVFFLLGYAYLIWKIVSILLLFFLNKVEN